MKRRKRIKGKRREREREVLSCSEGGAEVGFVGFFFDPFFLFFFFGWI